MFLPSLLWLLLLVAPAPALIAWPTACGGDTPLSTPYLAAFHKREEAAHGCQVGTPAGGLHQVHVLRLTGHLPEVFLDVAGEAPSSLVLMSNVPTVWHLSTSSPDLPTILLSVGSSAIDATTGAELESSPALITSIATAAKIARNRFGHLNTVTTVSKAANRVFASLPEELAGEPPCVGAVGRGSRAVRAYTVERQSSYGCYHQENAGLLPNDVHVIDLRDGSARLRRSTGDHLPEVVVEVGPELADSQPPLPRNLTLVLKSDSKVRWMLKSSGIKGRLLVAAGSDPVEEVAVGEGQQLEIQHATIPDQFEGLMEEVTNQYGKPLSYLRVHHANLLEMTVPPRSKRELAQLREDRGHQYETSRPSVSQTKSLAERIYAAAEEIEVVMEKRCNEERKEMAVSVPAATLTQLGVASITLNDATCGATKTVEAWTVSSHSTKCGSTALIQGSVPMFRNNLNIKFGSGPLAGQQTKISFICKFRPCIPGVSCSREEEDLDDPDDYPGAEEEDEEEEMYSLAVTLATAGHKTSLLEKRGDSATIALGDEIHVRSHINAVPYLALAMEQCWLSSSPHPSSHARTQDTRLISEGCPARGDVSATWTPGDSNSAFSFRVSSSLPAKVWLQCRLGLCSGTTAGASGNILQCVHPAESCGPGAAPHQESALQQVTVRGPLHVLPQPRQAQREAPRGHTGRKGEEEEEGEESHSPRPSSRTLVEVPVEVAIAISLASFIVGALSTGVLWFLHSRSLRAKSEQLRSVLAAEGTELQSMLGLPPSSAPPATTTPGDHNGNCPACPLVLS